MGPGSKLPERTASLADPPMFTPDGDLRDWRRRVGRWVDYVKAAHDTGVDRHFKTIYKILGRTLYERGLPVDQQAIVEEAQVKGIINYKQDDDPIASVRDIVRTVAVDPPIATVSRLIASFKNVMNCRRGNKETLPVFVSRFRGLAAKHLLHAKVSSSSQIGEVLAVTLLNNCNLDDNTLVNATSALLALADAREASQKDCATVEVSTISINKLARLCARLSALEKEREIPRDGSERKKFMETFRSKCIDTVKLLVPAMQDVEQLLERREENVAVEDILMADQKQVVLNLDDAVTVLRSLTQANQTSSLSHMSSRDINALVDRKVSSLLASHNLGHIMPRKGGAGSSKSTQRTRTASRGRGRKRTRTEQDGNSGRCYDCGEDGHYRGDDACKSPSYMSALRKKHRPDSDKPSRGEDAPPGGQRGAFFRPRSGPGSSK